jgi:hypothetical protein
MRKTAITCDICKGDIDTSKPWTSINVAVPEDVATEVADDFRQQAREYGGSRTFLGIDIPIATPTHCTVEICRRCEDEKFGDLRPMVAVMLLTELEQRRERASKPSAKARFERAD